MKNSLFVPETMTRQNIRADFGSAASPLRIWLNHTYATNYWIAKMIKDNPDGMPVVLLTTGKNPLSPVLQAGDYMEIEPPGEVVGDEYVDWTLDFARQHNVDVFIPMREIGAIAARVAEFNAFGTNVLVSPPSSIDLLEDKNLAYETCKELGIAIPPWRVATGAHEMLNAYNSLQDEIGTTETVCIKPVQGVGATGFRRITNRKPDLDSLLLKPQEEVSLDSLLAILQTAEDNSQQIPEYMLMPYLDEPEISFDCLSDYDGALITSVSRSKNGKIRSLTNKPMDAAKIVHQICDAFSLAYLTNTQIRWYHGQPVLLETNTRISGGMYAASLGGLNFPWEAIKLSLTGKTSEDVHRDVDLSYTSVSSVVRFRD